MAGVSTEQGSNKLNSELNLVPFIDLLSSLVLFLLLTAVWLQVSTLPASVDSKGKAQTSPADQHKISIRLTTSGYQISWPAAFANRGLPGVIPKGRIGFNTDQLAAAFQKAAKSTKLSQAAVAADDEVSYDAVVQAVDAIKSIGGVSVALSTD